MTYVDPKNIVEVIERQNPKIREQEAQIAALQAEVERLRKLAPWNDKPQIEITAGPFEGWKGRLHQDDTQFAKVILGTEDPGMMIALLVRSIDKCHIKYTQEPA